MWGEVEVQSEQSFPSQAIFDELFATCPLLVRQSITTVAALTPAHMKYRRQLMKPKLERQK